MKKFILISVVLVGTLAMSSCSKCYDCVEIQEIYDSNGNVIDETEVSESICTADKDEIEKREAAGAVCSN